MTRRALLLALGVLKRDRLLEYRDPATGDIRPVRTEREWERFRRPQILTAMQEIMGPLPGKEKQCPLDVRVEGEEDAGKCIRRLITYASEPNAPRVPAYLLIPKPEPRPGSARAVLCLHPTDNTIGHKVVVGLGGLPNRQYALELSSRGYVTLSPAYPLLANYQPDWRALGYRSGTMKAIHDNRRALDLLESLPYVRKKGGAGVIGHSLGGHNSVYTAIFDSRIRAIVSSCGLDSYADYMKGDIRGWTSDRYMPKLLDYAGKLQDLPFDFHGMLAVLAPRACLISAPFGDANFRWESVDRVVASARQVYSLYGSSEALRVIHPDSAHDFPDGARQTAYAMFDSALAR